VGFVWFSGSTAVLWDPGSRSTSTSRTSLVLSAAPSAAPSAACAAADSSRLVVSLQKLCETSLIFAVVLSNVMLISVAYVLEQWLLLGLFGCSLMQVYYCLFIPVACLVVAEAAARGHLQRS